MLPKISNRWGWILFLLLKKKYFYISRLMFESMRCIRTSYLCYNNVWMTIVQVRWDKIVLPIPDTRHFLYIPPKVKFVVIKFSSIRKQRTKCRTLLESSFWEPFHVGTSRLDPPLCERNLILSKMLIQFKFKIFTKWMKQETHYNFSKIFNLLFRILLSRLPRGNSLLLFWRWNSWRFYYREFMRNW